MNKAKLAIQIKLFIALTCSTILLGCAETAINKQIDQEVAQEPAVKNRAQLKTEAKQMIENANNLTSDQKAKLIHLRNSTSSQLDQDNTDSLKLRSLLIQDLTSSNYKDKEVTTIKNRIRKVENHRIDAMLNAVDEANRIMGRQTLNRENVLRSFADRTHGD
jgi:ABC-type uncharacterized transport system auxiliary subunit